MMKNTKVITIADGNGVFSAFEIVDKLSGEKVTMVAPSESDKRFWLKKIKDTLRVYLQQRNNQMRAEQGGNSSRSLLVRALEMSSYLERSSHSVVSFSDCFYRKVDVSWYESECE